MQKYIAMNTLLLHSRSVLNGRCDFTPPCWRKGQLWSIKSLSEYHHGWRHWQPVKFIDLYCSLSYLTSEDHNYQAQWLALLPHSRKVVGSPASSRQCWAELFSWLYCLPARVHSLLSALPWYRSYQTWCGWWLHVLSARLTQRPGEEPCDMFVWPLIVMTWDVLSLFPGCVETLEICIIVPWQGTQVTRGHVPLYKGCI